MTGERATGRPSSIPATSRSASRKTPSPMSMHPAFGRARLSPRSPRWDHSGRPSPSIRIIWKNILTVTPATSFGQNGRCRTGRTKRHPARAEPRRRDQGLRSLGGGADQPGTGASVCGDGGFMMNSQELETAVRLKLNLVVLVLEDRAYGMIRWKQEVDGFADFGLNFGNPDLVAYAKSYGARCWRVGKPAEFKTMLEAAFGEGGVHLVVAPIDYSENMRVLVARAAFGMI